MGWKNAVKKLNKKNVKGPKKVKVKPYDSVKGSSTTGAPWKKSIVGYEAGGHKEEEAPVKEQEEE